MKKNIKNLNELSVFVQSFLRQCQKKQTATIISLSGDLGAGKTAWVKSAAEYFGIGESITSPTFVIQKEYEINNHHFFKKMIHIDAYRLENKSDLEYLDWAENISRPENIIFLEWPEQVSGIDVPNVTKIDIKILDNEEREIVIHG